jgi:hypothetical protein
MLDVKGFDFSNVHRILEQNSIPKAGGISDFADSIASTLLKLDTVCYYKIKICLK